MQKPEDIQAIGDILAIRWADRHEDFLPMDKLRAVSPSAETQGEHDLLGNLIGGGGDFGKDYSGVVVTGWKPVGGYAYLFTFSDGHNTGIYSYDYLREIGKAMAQS
ncbi:MAG: gamma-butyrobetaine hydroxylase-like domain-containing protein [Verrucomicrobiales bacterium]